MTALAERNRAILQAAFDRWRADHGSLFDLLADDAEWTIAGTHWPAGTYRGRDHYVTAAITPLFRRLAEPTVPEDVRLLSDGDEVVARWSQETPLVGGGTYRNRYAWFLAMRDERIVGVTAFLDFQAYVQAVCPNAEADPQELVQR